VALDIDGRRVWVEALSKTCTAELLHNRSVQARAKA
jgi:hypothetical protein